MNQDIQSSADGEIIDIDIDIDPNPRKPWRRWLMLALLPLAFLLVRALSLYVESLWYGSLGYAAVFWYTIKLKVLLCAGVALLTFALLRGVCWLLERSFAAHLPARRAIVLQTQTLVINPALWLRRAGWVAALVIGLGYGLSMTDDWQTFALYFNHTAAAGVDPIFGKSVTFYLFALPVYQLITAWLSFLAFVVIVAAALYAVACALPGTASAAAQAATRRTSWTAVSLALGGLLLTFAANAYLSRFPYLWEDHASFSGVTYTEANYLLPGLLLGAIALALAALLIIGNGLTKQRVSWFAAALALPLATYVIAALIVPSYIQSFVVKPNELDRETPFIQHNIEATRRAFGLEKVEARSFEAEPQTAALSLATNGTTLDNIRLWDWRALQGALHQMQQIRTYYDFPDVDIDRYKLDGKTRQVMIAARELDANKLPEQSRNWVNQKLIYTHGYGVTMNPANGFTPEGMPRFTLSNMPIESAAPELKITRPEIYFGQSTDTDVYVNTTQKEFDYPQGEANTTTVYQGNGGFSIGGFFRRLLIAWELGDSGKLPFSDAVTPDSRVLMRRNIRERVAALAPFLIYDADPYIVINSEGRLVWLMDAFTESSNYPYSRHHDAGGRSVNYIRNSVKVTVDAYNGNVSFYIFDPTDPLIQTYRAAFPALFQDAAAMPADLRAHIRYPETLIKTQAEVYNLYHTQDAKAFFQREDVWSIASQVGVGKDGKQQSAALDPYFVLMQLPGEKAQDEFVEIVPFTPANRNNMIGWMAGRSDGDAYGSLLVYRFPSSRLVDGPLQIEARIDQNAQLSSQLTLWNQQGSKALRGNLLVIPMNQGLLYVQPIYLQAERSPMPELRLVVLATQESLAYGTNFGEALASLMGDTGKAKAPDTAPKPDGTTPPPAVSAPQLINRATQAFDDYQRLTKEGKFGEAGQKLDELRRALGELQKQPPPK